MRQYPLIRTIYLYIFALLGLALITIGAVRFVNMGLKTFVFTKADEDQRYMFEPPMPYQFPRADKTANQTSTSEIEQEQMNVWVEDYKKWKERRGKVDYRVIRLHQDASMNIALILVGLPLYLYHWTTIQRETKNSDPT